MNKFLIPFAVAFFSFSYSTAQTIAVLTVPVNDVPPGMSLPLSVDLDEITLLPDSVISLVEVADGKRIPVACQIENRGERVLHWLIDNSAPGDKKRVFELVKRAPLRKTASMQVMPDEGALLIKSGEKKLLQYNYKTHYPPAGVDTAFKRSGFIHPLWAPHGQALTRISPPDHYHHYGLWNPWTKVLFEGETVDFWNLKEKKGTVRFAELLSINEGAVYADYRVLHQHVVFKKNGTEKVAINELQSVRIYEPGAAQDHYIADITIQLGCASESPVVLEEYRYGGLGWRATEKWNKRNSEILTSGGKARKDADGTKARWVIVQGSLDEDYGGAVMMSFPSNYNHPEPLRIWPENIMENGDVYANFSPTKDKDWPLLPGRDYVLKYRFLVFNGKMDAQKAEAAWQYFARKPKVTIRIISSK